MAWTAHKDEEQMRETIDSDEAIDDQASRIADLIKNAKHFVAFTGAGISTSAGIPDFRGPQGVWTLRAQGKTATSRVSTHKASPTKSHMALVALQRGGYLKFLISQNTDGLHRRSGFPTENLAELHGNTNLETCSRCGKEYFRDFGCRSRNLDVHDHKTGRLCVCGGSLKDSIINFSENLPEKALRDGFEHASRADLMLVLGSSLTVTPAADMPRRTVERGGRLVICNLQKTPLDELATIRPHARTDDLLTKILAKLNVTIPDWRLQRQLIVEANRSSSKQAGFDDWRLKVFGVEADGTPASIFSGVEIQLPNVAENLVEEPFICNFTVPSSTRCLEGNVVLYFMGHYNEPPLSISVTIDLTAKNQNQTQYRLLFDPRTGDWQVDAFTDTVCVTVS